LARYAFRASSIRSTLSSPEPAKVKRRVIWLALVNRILACFRWLERAYNDHDAVVTATIAFYPGSQRPRFIDFIKPAKAIPRRN
jgi:hypothetical protein